MSVWEFRMVFSRWKKRWSWFGSLSWQVDQATQSNWQIVYLKEVAEELISEEPSKRSSLAFFSNNTLARISFSFFFPLALPQPLSLKAEYVDRLILSRLALTPDHMTDDPELITVIASLSRDETAFQFLGGCWKRERAERYKVVLKKVSSIITF